MALARFKDLCIDAVDGPVVGEFWAKALGLTWNVRDDGSGWVSGSTPEHTIWICPVPEAKAVKNRVHLDIYARSLADIEVIGSTMLVDNPAWRWTIMADPEGGDYCAFVREELPAERLHGLVVDCKDPAAIAAWWAQVYDAEVVHHDEGYSTVQNVPGMPIQTMDFVPVPEPKVLKNRVHWDVVAADIPALVAAGATVLREPDDEIRWTVMADPDGNEFCAFAPSASA